VTTPFQTLIFAVSFGYRCFLWPHLRVTRAASVFAVSNSNSCLSADWMLSQAQASSFLMIWFMSLPDTTHPTLSTKDRPSTPQTISSTQVISPEVLITKRIRDTGEPCGIPASTGSLSITLPSITISTVQSDRQLAIHCLRSLSILLPLNGMISLPLPTVGKAALISIRSMLAMLPCFQAGCALSTLIATTSNADHVFLLPY